MIKSLQTLIVIIALILGIKLATSQAVWAFVITGAVPGTDHTLSASTMLTAYASIVWLVFCQPGINRMIVKLISKTKLAKKVPTVRMPQRRFSQI